MKRLFTLLISLVITAFIVMVLHERFMKSIPLRPGTEPIVVMEVFGVVALILALSLGHILEAAKILHDDNNERLRISFLDILKVLFTIGASGAMYLALLDHFKPHGPT
jgi:hypothetical protein